MIKPDFQKSPPLIMVVDDERTLRTLLCRAMLKQGYQVVEACNGQHCLDICDSQKPDMILLDAMMPGIDGFSCCTTLQALYGDHCPPILMVTVLDDQESVEKAFTAGATDYVTKPIDWGLLAQRVSRLLTSRWAILSLRSQIEKECRLTVNLEASNRELHNLSYVDILTQLASRSYFNEYFEREWMRLQKYQLPLALILCEIDFFGSESTDPDPVQDECLRLIAQSIRKCKRSSTDFIARYSEAQFAIVLANTPDEVATDVVQTIQAAVKSLSLVHVDSTLNEYVTLSFGTASIIPDQQSSPKMLTRLVQNSLAENKAGLRIKT